VPSLQWVGEGGCSLRVPSLQWVGEGGCSLRVPSLQWGQWKADIPESASAASDGRDVATSCVSLLRAAACGVTGPRRVGPRLARCAAGSAGPTHLDGSHTVVEKVGNKDHVAVRRNSD
jgi:hypothetical protein